MPAVPPPPPGLASFWNLGTPLAALFSFVCRFVAIVGRFGADSKTWFFGIAPNIQNQRISRIWEPHVAILDPKA